MNVLTGSDGIIRGAIGGHPDTASGAAMSIVVCPLLRGRIPCVVDKVTTLVTPGETVDVIVTDRGVAVNPRRSDLLEAITNAKIKVKTIEQLRDEAHEIIGEADPLPFGDKVVGVVTSPDGSVLDIIKNIVEYDLRKGGV